MTGNKIADKITNILGTSSQNYLEKVTNEEKNIGLDKEIPKERYISPEKKTENYWWSRINEIVYNNGISKIINLLVNTPNQPSNFITSSRVEINDESQRERERVWRQ